MKQVPNVDINNGKTVENYSLEECNQWRYIQALAGDTTDGYYGLKKCGPVGARKLIDSCYGSSQQVLIDTVVSAYLDKGETVEYAYQMINCAAILRYNEFDFDEMRPILKTYA